MDIQTKKRQIDIQKNKQTDKKTKKIDQTDKYKDYEYTSKQTDKMMLRRTRRQIDKKTNID